MSLTGCLYQVVQATGLQGTNVLKLIPVLKSKDNLIPVVPSPVIPSASTLNVAQAVRIPLPSPVSNTSLPCPVSVPLLQPTGVGNYIITTQRDLATNSKTIRVDNTVTRNQDATILSEKSQLNLAPNFPPGKHTFIMMNTKSTPVPVKSAPMLPSGHRLQIPAHAEVRSVPASSLPLCIQQKILPHTSCNDITKAPSVIYVSPVNTIKTLVNQVPSLCAKPNSSNIVPITKSSPLVPTPGQAPLETAKGPMRWIVQENKESAACLVPVKSSSDTASKILQMLSGAKTEEIHLTSSDSSKIMQIKDNALVMCNNKIFFLTKKGTELSDRDHKKPEPPQYVSPDKSETQSEPMKDLSNKVVQVVLSKNKSPSPNGNQSSSSGIEASAHPNVGSTLKPNRTSVPLPANRIESNVIYISDDVDGSEAIVKPRDTEYGLPNTTGSTKVNAADKVPQECGFVKKIDQVSSMTKVTMDATNTPATDKMDDGSLRLKFGLIKKEKIILKRIPLLRMENTSKSKGPAETQRHQLKRKTSTETAKASKVRKNIDGTDLNMTADTYSDYLSSSHEPAPVRLSVIPPLSVKSPSPFLQKTAPGGSSSPSQVLRDTEATTAEKRSGSTHSPPHYSTETSTSPSDSVAFHLGQDITGHFSEVSLPNQRFPFSSVYLDDTTKDEKIQRLKEVLKEREQALEALRRQKK